MKGNLAYGIIALGIILGLLSLIYGSFMPLQKSRRYISGLRSVSSIRTTQEFRAIFERALKHPSPIGDEEIIKYLASDIVNIISRPGQEAVARDLVSFVEPYAFKNNVRHLMTMAQAYSLLWQNYGREEDFKKAEDYYKRALKIGPKLPPVLYGLFNLYEAKRDKTSARKIGEVILRYWPEDERIRKAIL